MGGTRKHYVAVGRGVQPMVVLFQFMGKGHALFAYTPRRLEVLLLRTQLLACPSLARIVQLNQRYLHPFLPFV